MYASGPGFFIFFQETGISAGGGYPVVFEIPATATKRVAKKVRAYVKAKKDINPDAIEKIVESMVESWPKAEMTDFMVKYDLPPQEAMIAFRQGLTVFLDDDLALILIIASI